MTASQANANAIGWYKFLARPRLPAPSDEVLDQLRSQSILVTGAGGSIGSALSLRLAALRPKKLLLLDASELALHGLQNQLANEGLLRHARPILGNCSNTALLEDLLESGQLIFHAAAYKHVPLLEEHPLEAIANNALATHTLALAAKRAGAARIVLLSTDKAAAPASILGATKRIAERITLVHNGIALRLANVLGTDGSVSEVFARQIASGAPLSITTHEAQRYFLTCDEAVDMLLASSIASRPMTLLAPDLAVQHRITDLALFIRGQLVGERELPIVFTGTRPGDKPSEVFCSGEETPSPSSIDGLVEISCDPGETIDSSRLLESLREAVQTRNLPLAIASVQQLVPDYTPSETILAQLRIAEVRQ